MNRSALSLDFGLNASSHDEELHSTGLESLLERIHGLVHVNGSSAVEEVYRCVPVLWPRVDRVVRLLDNHRARNPVRLELVETVRDNRGFADDGGIDHGLAYRALQLERLWIAIEQFDKKVRSQRR